MDLVYAPPFGFFSRKNRSCSHECFPSLHRVLWSKLPFTVFLMAMTNANTVMAVMNTPRVYTGRRRLGGLDALPGSHVRGLAYNGRMIEVEDQWQDREPTEHERLAMAFVDQVIDQFREDLTQVHGEEVEPIIDHAKGQIWMHLCVMLWNIEKTLPKP